MATWPSFSRHLAGNPPGAMDDLLAEVADLVASRPAPEDLLRLFFEDDALATRLAPHVTALDHVGALAPVGSDLSSARRALLDSKFRHGLLEFRSRILAADLTVRVGHAVRIDVVEARIGESRSAGPGFEWFVSDLPADELAPLVRTETGCHVALRLDPHSDLAMVREIASRTTTARGSISVTPVRANAEIDVRLVYVERTDGDGRTRRLEFVVSD